MIEMFPSYLEGPALATYRTRKRMTLDAWMRENMETYESRDPDQSGRLVVLVNGEVVPPEDWATAEFGPDDYVRMHPAPGGGVGKALGSVFSGALKVLDVLSLGLLGKLMGALTPKADIPSASREQGDRLSSSTIRNNMARLNSPIREAAGLNRIYPDLILPVRRYYRNRKEQWVEVMMCIGVGLYEKSLAGVFVGDTSAVDLGDDVQIQFYNPGESVAGDSAAEWWHTPSEVGFTSFGGSGIKLEVAEPADELWTSGIIIGTTAVTSSPAVPVPESWEEGDLVRIEAEHQIQHGGNWVSSSVLDRLSIQIGEEIELTGANAGNYMVSAITPAGSPSPGSPATVTGSVPPARYDFGQDPAAINLLLNFSSYTVSLTTDLTGIDQLISVINSQLNSAPIRARNEGGALELYQTGSYIGGTISVSGDVADLFGSPIVVSGTASSDGSDTRYHLGDVAFVPGSDLASAGRVGMRYEIISKSTNAITVRPQGLTSWPGFPSGISSGTSYIAAAGGQGGYSGPFVAVPPGETANRLEIDIFFPRGLIHYNKKGRKEKVTGSGAIEWRYIGQSTWNSQSFSVTDASEDQMGFTYTVNLPTPGRVEVRLRRDPGVGWENTMDEIQWTGLKARIVGAPSRYEGVSTMTVKLRTGDRISGSVENEISVRATRMISRIGESVGGPTRNIADWVRYVCHTVGYTDDDIDMPELIRLHNIWSARGDFYDDSISDSSTVKQVLSDALGAGFAELTVQRGIIHPVRDEPRYTLDDAFVFTPQNYRGGGGLVKTTELIKHDDFDGVDVEYIGPESNQWETVQCRLPGDQGLRVDKIRVQGVKDRTRAWRIGMRHRRALQYRRTQFQWSTEMDLFNCGYMGFVSLTDDVPGYGQSAMVEDVAYVGGKAVIISTEPLHWEEGHDHLMALRRPDGTLSGPYPAIQVDEMTAEIGLPDFEVVPFSDAPDIEPTHIQFGTAQRWSYLALIQDVSPSGATEATATAVNYDPRVYADDNNAPA